MDRYQFNILKKRDAGLPLSPVEKMILYKDLDPYMSLQLQKYDMMRQIENRNKVLIDKDELDGISGKANLIRGILSQHQTPSIQNLLFTCQKFFP